MVVCGTIEKFVQNVPLFCLNPHPLKKFSTDSFAGIISENIKSFGS